MVALLLRLKWTLLKAGFRRNGWQLAGFIIGLVLGVVAALGLAAGLVSTRGLDVELAAGLVTLLLAITGFTLFLVPLVATGVDDTLDPSRFALLPVRARALLPGLVLGSFVGVTGLVMVLAAVGAVAALVRSPAVTVAALVAAPVWLVLTVVLRNAAAAGISSPRTPRWVRDLATGIGIVLAASSGLAANGLTAGVSSIEELRERVDLLATVAGWTPFGLPWAAVQDVAGGNWLSASIRAVLVVALLGVLLWWWERAIAARLVSPLESSGSGREVRAGALTRLAPATPAGAVMMRSLINWRRDPRYVMNFAVSVLMPVLFVAPALMQGAAVRDMPYLPYVGAAVALSFAMVTMQDTSYDGSAVWMHVVSGIRGRDDRLGRFLALLPVALPLVVLAVVVGCVLSGRWDQAWNALGVSLGLLCVGAGVGQVTSALWQFPAPQPGANQFSTPAGGTLATFLAMVVTWVAMLVVAAGAAGLWFATHQLGWVHQLMGPAVLLVGAAVAWVCIVGSGRWLDRRWPQVLANVTESAA
ncbi:hypothetical protein [Kytococcus sedentarius]|uniref:hypothetical protein n=1 Tax=Kytococcus sedentarius TaxID=1276 RepID=UPI0035BC2613